MFCEAIEELQREALDSPRPQVVVKVDRSGLNEHHPVVQRLYAAIERVLRPIVAAEERRAGAHLIVRPAPSARATRSVCARSTTRSGARSTRPGAGFERGGTPSDRPPSEPSAGEQSELGAPSTTAPPSDATPIGALRFKQSPVRLHPGEQRGVSLLIDPDRVPPGTPIDVVLRPRAVVEALGRRVVPEPAAGRLVAR